MAPAATAGRSRKAGRKSQPRHPPDPLAPWYASRRPRASDDHSTRPPAAGPKAGGRRRRGARGRARGPDGRFLRAAAAAGTCFSAEEQPEPRRDCTVCAETKEAGAFPTELVSDRCLHAPGVCLECIQTSVRVDLGSASAWNQIRCPECGALLDYHHVRKYADADTFSRYEALSLRAAVGAAPDFVWCPAGCGSGQVHEGAGAPIVSCVQCGHRFCFVHRDVAWHEGWTCADYDGLQRDPRGFRRQIDIDNEAVERQEEADRLYAQSLVENDDEELAQARQEAQRAAEREQLRRERAALEEEVRRAEQKRRQEARSLEKIRTTTQVCPGCRWPIEKKDGCDHMTCSQCHSEFCYQCGADFTYIRTYGNASHKPACPWYA